MSARGALALLGLVAALAAVPATAKDTGLIFVSNEKTNNLIVIDPRTHKIVKDIKTSRRPRDMHFSADRKLLYVACGDDDVIDIIDVAKLEVVGKLSTGPSPETFAIDERRRRIYVANEEGSTLSIIDMDQNVIVHEVPTGAEPEGVFLSEDGKHLYVTSEVGDLIHLVEADSGHVIEDVVVGTRPQDRVPAARPAQERRHAGRLGHDAGRQDRLRDARPRRPRGGRRRRHPPCPGLHPGRQALMGDRAVGRREDALCRQRLRRRYHADRRAAAQGDGVASGRPGPVGRGHR
jgi:YVTN family beta-propeller protein